MSREYVLNYDGNSDHQSDIKIIMYYTYKTLYSPTHQIPILFLL